MKTPYISIIGFVVWIALLGFGVNWGCDKLIEIGKKTEELELRVKWAKAANGTNAAACSDWDFGVEGYSLCVVKDDWFFPLAKEHGVIADDHKISEKI